MGGTKIANKAVTPNAGLTFPNCSLFSPRPMQIIPKGAMTIFLTTEYMEEADRLANRLCIVDQGKIVSEGTPAKLKAQVGADKITLRFKIDDHEGCEKAKDLFGLFASIRANIK